ncbi:MAG: patatin-like phospholipase family protein [Bacteroidales bacterium]|nr:patatin-like phospholipase family protein [Bacteroidales bacterium]
MNNLFRFTFSFVLLCSFLTLFGQQRPKVAVVLSGGGAKGMAHVGFLKVMEQAGIVPDMILGTSMGSIVGGLYSIGFTPDSIEKMMIQQDWDLILGNKVGLRQINMEEKREYDKYISEFPLKGIVPQLPKGVIKGHELELLFEKLTWTAAGDTNFDDFNIPFRCVAVDMLEGKPYIFQSGQLSVAMRASMSIPTIMEPVKYRGMLLVDGGLINNFPVDVAKEMGADIIIGVYVGGQLKSEEELKSVFSLLTQSSLMASILDAKKKKPLLDVYIEPYLNDLTAADFDKSKLLIQRGFDESMKNYDQLLKISKELQKYPLKEIERKPMIDSIRIGEFETTKIENPNTRKMVSNIVGTNLGGIVNSDDIHQEINVLFGTRLFDKIGYELNPIDSVKYSIKYHIDESPTKLLNFAFNYSSDVEASLILQLILRNQWIRGSKFELKTRLGREPALFVRYMKYLDANYKNNIAFGYSNMVSSYLVYDLESGKFSQNYRFRNNRFFFEYNRLISLSSEFKAFYKFESQYFTSRLAPKLGEFETYKLKGNYVGLAYQRNSLDKKYFPKSGSEMDLITILRLGSEFSKQINENDTSVQIHELTGATDNPDQFFARFSFSNYFGKNKLIFSNNANVFFSSDNFYNLNSFIVGGVNDYGNYQNISFYGMPFNYAFANTGLIYRFSARYELVNKLYVSLTANGLYEVDSYQNIFKSTVDWDRYFLGYGAGVSYESPIGPVSVFVSKNLSYSHFWTYFNIGYQF